MKPNENLKELMATDMKTITDGWERVKSAKTTDEVIEGLTQINLASISLSVLTSPVSSEDHQNIWRELCRHRASTTRN